MRILLLLLIFASGLQAQLITGTYDFQSDPAKKYALFIPSTYSADVPSKVIVGLHPWNTQKWDAESWALELSELAEANNAIIICPDGGADGQIDDDIDTAFTSFLIEQVEFDYNIAQDSVYLVGFSWGGRTVYTYGLSNKNKFAGFMPIGSAVELSVVKDLIVEVKDLPFYIIHGSQDNPLVRFYPIRDALIEAEACVETDLLASVGHTIDFPNQFEVLNTGFQWLLNNSCGVTNSTFKTEIPDLIKTSVVDRSVAIEFQSDIPQEYTVSTMTGQIIAQGRAKFVEIDAETGYYIITIKNNKTYKVFLR